MSKAQQLITEHIDIWTSAIVAKSGVGRGSSKKRELYGIKKLRELILELAVRGKLVPQDPRDEPASELLKNIAAERAEIATKGKTRKPDVLHNIYDGDVPFKQPVGWEWALMGDICEIERGGSPRPIKSYITESEDGLNWIKIGDTDIGGKYITKTAEKIRPEGLSKTRQVYPGDFLLTNSMSFGRPYITEIKGCIHDGWLRISPPTSINKDYLYNLLSSPFIVRSFKKSASGAVVMNLNADKVRETVVAIPPTREQHRIVAKVDELMLLCDQLEQQTEDSIDAHATLVDVLLSTLTNSANADELAQNWARVAEHFDTLFTTEQSIDALKQTILQLAVMGKLVPQNLDDEPASVLLEKIATEKANLVKEGKIKKQKLLPTISKNERPFELPNGWECYRLGEMLTKLGSGSTPRGGSSAYVSKGIPFLRSQNVWNEGLKLDDIAYIDDKTHISMGNTTVYPGDILLNITGASLGRSVIFPNMYPEGNVSQHVTIIRLVEPSMTPFLQLCIRSPLIQKFVWGRQVGMAIEGLSKKVLELFEMPIPPLAEQHRIVAKVDELFEICEQLKNKLQQSQQTQVHLTDALVENALA